MFVEKKYEGVYLKFKFKKKCHQKLNLQLMTIWWCRSHSTLYASVVLFALSICVCQQGMFSVGDNPA